MMWPVYMIAGAVAIAAALAYLTGPKRVYTSQEFRVRFPPPPMPDRFATGGVIRANGPITNLLDRMGEQTIPIEQAKKMGLLTSRGEVLAEVITVTLEIPHLRVDSNYSDSAVRKAVKEVISNMKVRDVQT